MVFLGSLLMVYNIYGFIRFARSIRNEKGWDANNKILYIPIFLLIFFLLGYIAVGFFGDPDLIVSGILFGGSIFVFVIYLLLTKITDRVSEGQHLEAQLMAAEQSNRVNSEFLASMSHEMRTPLNVIIGLDTVALSEPDLSPDTRHRLEKIGESAKYLLGLINNILALNSSEADKIELKKEPFPLSDAVRQINALTSSMCAGKGLSYKFSAADDVDGSYIGDETVITRSTAFPRLAISAIYGLPFRIRASAWIRNFCSMFLMCSPARTLPLPAAAAADLDLLLRNGI